MITEAAGNLLGADVDAMVNTVNTVGVMGKGIALQFRRAYPAMFDAYAKAAKAGDIRLGRMNVWTNEALTGPRYIINFPTKRHWKARSELGDIEAGLVDLVRVVRSMGIKSIAVPPLGCGNGGLEWAQVQPLIARAFANLPEIDIRVYPPAGAPPAAAMTTATPRPKWTVGKAALVDLVARYGERALDVSIIEVQKLMYFSQEAGEPLRLEYREAIYGPYAENLQKVLRTVEGHFLTGYGDGSLPVASAEPIAPLPGAAEEAARFLAHHPATRARTERVLDLADGYESGYAMELLSTVHWVATHEPYPAVDAGAAADRVATWSARKATMFTADHVRTAWDRLASCGWLPVFEPTASQYPRKSAFPSSSP
ncbi:MAG: type II toxin-antitoxin system antitoxin DNA ADP-ribosyl glycohydrolase DarG [Acidimicrobiales bacterium]